MPLILVAALLQLRFMKGRNVGPGTAGKLQESAVSMSRDRPAKE